ncbi:MAG: hypothetical protein QXR45_15335 [Candidatus Bathyarchaeia archaeon]
MDIKWVALVLIALVVGLGIGFASSYLIFQQIMSLRIEIVELERRISNLESTISSLNLPEIRNELDELKSKLSNITLAVQELLSREQYAKYERLEIPTAYASGGSKIDYYQITLELVNTGATAIIITGLFINGVPYTAFTGVTINPPLGTILSPNSSTKLQIYISRGVPMAVPGAALTIGIQTATGNQYIKTIILP